MISLSPLSTTHPRSFQRTPVRSSTRCYPCFNLVMDRSLGFVSKLYDYIALFTLAFASTPERMSFNLALQLNSLAHHAKGTPSAVARVNSSHRPPTVCKLLVSGSISLPYKGFFSPFPRGTGSLSVINEYLALEGGPPRFRPDFTWPALLRCQSHQHFSFSCTGLSPSTTGFPTPFH